MGRMATPSLYPGERSLPAELRTAPGGNFAQRRLAASLQPSASPTSWNQMRLRGLMGVHGLGQGDSGGDGSTDLNPGDVNLNQLVPEVISPVLDSSGNVDIPLPPDCSSFALTAAQASACGLSTVTDPNNVGSNALSALTAAGVPTTAATAAALVATAPAGSGINPVQPANANVPAAPSGYQWAQLVNSEGNTLAKVLTIAQGGSSVTLPNGTQLLYGSAGSAASASGVLGALSSVTGLNSSTLLLVGAGVLVFFLMEGRK